jgi:hypothetical protein
MCAARGIARTHDVPVPFTGISLTDRGPLSNVETVAGGLAAL